MFYLLVILYLKKLKNNLIIIESTIAPGTTEDICLNLISKKWN